MPVRAVTSMPIDNHTPSRNHAQLAAPSLHV